MPYSATEQRRFGLKKEVVRGTAETTPAKWYPVDKSTTLNYDMDHIKDLGLRGIIDEYPHIAGRKKGDGKIKMAADAQTIGEFLHSLLGSVASVQQGATTAYQHTFTRDASSLARPAYTFFMDYGQSIIKKYNLGVVRKMSLQGPVDNLVEMEADVSFKSEADGVIGTPAFPAQRYMAFNHAAVKIGGGTVTDIKSWQVNMESGSQPLHSLGQSADIQDIIVRGKQMISGNFVIFFTGETERAKMLANTTNSLEVLLTHTDLAGVAFPYSIDLLLPKIHYKSYPFGEEDGLLAAKVDFEAVYDTVTSKTVSAVIVNADTAY